MHGLQTVFVPSHTKPAAHKSHPRNLPERSIFLFCPAGQFGSLFGRRAGAVAGALSGIPLLNSGIRGAFSGTVRGTVFGAVSGAGAGAGGCAFVSDGPATRAINRVIKKWSIAIVALGSETKKQCADITT